MCISPHGSLRAHHCLHGTSSSCTSPTSTSFSIVPDRHGHHHCPPRHDDVFVAPPQRRLAMFVLVEIVNPQIVWPLEFGAEVDVPPCHRVSCFAIPGCPAASWGGGRLLAGVPLIVSESLPCGTACADSKRGGLPGTTLRSPYSSSRPIHRGP